MNKKTAVALAVGAVFATPVFAQSNVQIYGRLYPQLQWAKGEDATVGAPPSNLFDATSTGGNHDGRLAVETQNSRIGFRGREMLGGGLNAIWQIETRTRFDTGSGNLWAGGRNSFVGVQGGFGTVKLGNMDTIYKEYGGQVGSWFGVGSGNFTSSTNILTEHGLGTGNGSFNVRRANSIQYETPEFGAFQAGFHYGPDERKGNPGTTTNANLWSTGVKYEAGPLYVSVQYERHNDQFSGSDTDNTVVGGSATDSKDQATRLSVGYEITKQHKITADIARMSWEESGHAAGETGTFQEYEKTTWGIGWEARWGGPWRTEITYLHGPDGKCTLTGGVACSTSGLKSTQINAGVGYSLSKRTLLYGLAAKHRAGPSAQFDPAPFGASRGEDVTQFALGMSHSF